MNKNNDTNKLIPQIGQIVTLKTHYTRANKDILDKIYIAGDDKSIPPFMMITEFCLETKNRFDEETGDEILGSGSHSCKVQWFNSKTYEISETWINSVFLEAVNNEKNKLKSFEKEDCVILRTNAFEIKKKRTSLKIQESTVNLNASSVVSFCAPEMIVMSKVVYKIKKPLIDKNTGEQIRFYPKQLLKFKYFNPITNKYSEGLLPIECFEEADNKIEKLDELLDPKNVILYNKKLFQVKNVSYLHGVYMAYCKNFVDGSSESLRSKDLMPFNLINKNDLTGTLLAPTWRNDKFESVSTYIQKKQKNKKDLKGNEKKYEFRPPLKDQFFFIEYRNLKGKYTERFIKILNTWEFLIKEGKKIKSGEREEQLEKDTKGMMVQAFCYLRGEERTFTFTDDRLLAIYEVDETKPINQDKDINIEEILENN